MFESLPEFPPFISKQTHIKEILTENLPKRLIASNLTIGEENTETIEVELTNQQLNFRHVNILLLLGKVGEILNSTHICFEILNHLGKISNYRLNTENCAKSKKLGFKISLENVQQAITFYCYDYQLLEKWLENLRLVINQLGFHKQFKAIRRLGKGQFATVFEVENLSNGERLAVKAFSKGQLAKTPKGMESLLNEIKILRSFTHTNLQKLLGVYESDNSIYIVTELLLGGSLFERLQKLYKYEKKVEADEIKEFMFGVLNGLKELSWGRIAHRDLKLDNIMLRSVNSFEPVIIDFGLATFVDEKEYLYYRCGTPGYVSPEVMNSKNAKVEPVCDIFSAASIFYHLLTSNPLFEGTTPEQVLKNNKLFCVNLSGLESENYDKDAVCLLKNMLEVDPKFRIEANEALVSEYFNIGGKLDSPLSTVTNGTEKEIREELSF